MAAAGMGMRLSTHYRKRNPTDAGHQKLIKGRPLLLGKPQQSTLHQAYDYLIPTAAAHGPYKSCFFWYSALV